MTPEQGGIPLSPQNPPVTESSEADGLDEPAREDLREVLRHLPRRTLWKVGTLLLLLAAVIFFRNRADVVVRLFGPGGVGGPLPTSSQSTPKGRENQPAGEREGISRPPVPSSPR